MKNDLLATGLSLKLKKPDCGAVKLLLHRETGFQRDRTGLGPGKVMLGIEYPCGETSLSVFPNKTVYSNGEFSVLLRVVCDQNR